MRSTNVDLFHWSTLKVEKINKYAARFRQVREELDLTQQQLAERLLLTRNFIAKIESGVAEPSARTLSNLETLLHQATRFVDDPAAPGVISLREDPSPYDPGRRDGPTEEQLLAQFMKTLEAARQVPGGLAYVWSQLKIHLSPEQIERLK